MPKYCSQDLLYVGTMFVKLECVWLRAIVMQMCSCCNFKIAGLCTELEVRATSVVRDCPNNLGSGS